LNDNKADLSQIENIPHMIGSAIGRAQSQQILLAIQFTI